MNATYKVCEREKNILSVHSARMHIHTCIHIHYMHTNFASEIMFKCKFIRICGIVSIPNIRHRARIYICTSGNISMSSMLEVQKEPRQEIVHTHTHISRSHTESLHTYSQSSQRGRESSHTHTHTELTHIHTHTLQQNSIQHEIDTFFHLQEYIDTQHKWKSKEPRQGATPAEASPAAAAVETPPQDAAK